MCVYVCGGVRGKSQKQPAELTTIFGLGLDSARTREFAKEEKFPRI